MNIWQSLSLIVLTNLLFFWQTLNYWYVSDDIPVSAIPNDEKKKDIEDMNGLITILRKKYPNKQHEFMPKLTELLHKWSYSAPKNFFKGVWQQFKGQRYFNPRVAHIITLSIHIVNCCLIYLAFGRNNVSLIASLFFAINPINCQGGSIWISGKPYSCAALMTLLMYALPCLSPIFYYATTLFSASAMLSALPFLLTKYWFLGIMPFIALPILKEVIQKKWCLHNSTNKEMITIAWRKIVPFMKSYGYYMRICTMPYKLGLYHSFLWGVGVNQEYNKYAYKMNKDFWIGFGMLIGTIGLILFNLHNMLGFGLFWFLVNIAMWSNFITIQQQIAERYVYLATIGLMLALAYLSASYLSVIVAILTYYATRLWSYRFSFMNDYWHIEYNAYEQPEAHYAWISKGIKKFYLNNFEGAIMDFAEARQRMPHDFKVNFNLAALLVCKGDALQAEMYLNEAEKCFYEGVEKHQRETFTDHTRILINRLKNGDRIPLTEVRIIK